MRFSSNKEMPNGETKHLSIWHGSDQCALECRQYQLELVLKPNFEKRWWAQGCGDNIFAALSSASHMPSPVLRKTDLQQSKPDTVKFTHKPPTDESCHKITPKLLIYCSILLIWFVPPHLNFRHNTLTIYCDEGQLYRPWTMTFPHQKMSNCKTSSYGE